MVADVDLLSWSRAMQRPLVSAMWLVESMAGAQCVLAAWMGQRHNGVFPDRTSTHNKRKTDAELAKSQELGGFKDGVGKLKWCEGD